MTLCYIYVYECVCLCACGQLVESVISFHYVCSKDGTQVIRFGGRHPHLLSHLITANPHIQPSAPWFSQVEIVEIRLESSSIKIAVNTSTSGYESSLPLTLLSLQEPRPLIHLAMERHEHAEKEPIASSSLTSCVATFSKLTHSFF